MLWLNSVQLPTPQQPHTPAALAASLTAMSPGIKGPLTGSTMISESRAWPSNCESPFRMPATCGPGPGVEVVESEVVSLLAHAGQLVACLLIKHSALFTPKNEQVDFKSMGKQTGWSTPYFHE